MADARPLDEIGQEYGIVLMLEFGSGVSGREHARSDREVDVAVINRADPLLLKRIVERCKLRFGPPRRLCELRMYAFRRYQDHRRYPRLE